MNNNHSRINRPQATFEFRINRIRSSSVLVHGPLLVISWPRMPPTYSV
ncbi:unnamed protein product, partial [Adineta steineri]